MNICRVAILQSSKDCSGSICKTCRALRRTRRTRRPCGEINRRKGRGEEVDAKTSARASDAKTSGDAPNNTARQIERLLDKVQCLWYACKDMPMMQRGRERPWCKDTGEKSGAKTSDNTPAGRSMHKRITQHAAGLSRAPYTTVVLVSTTGATLAGLGYLIGTVPSASATGNRTPLKRRETQELRRTLRARTNAC